jgi:hypothetical protein
MTMTTTMIGFREVDSEEMTSVDGGSDADGLPPICGVNFVYQLGQRPHPLGTRGT